MDLPENKLADLIKDNEKAMWRPVNNHNITQFTEDDILRITQNHGTLVGKGGFGEVYQGVLDNGTLVAVKKYIQKNYNEGFAKELIVHSHINHECSQIIGLLRRRKCFDGGHRVYLQRKPQ